MPRFIVLRSSPIHGKGIFAARDLPKGHRVIQYRGKLLTHKQTERAYGGDLDSGHTFLFTLNEKYVVDGNQGGNWARWINHSCRPNCEAVIHESTDGNPARDRIFIETLRPIRAGEELTYDYGIVPEERLTPALKKIWACHCGAPRCAGTLLKPKRSRQS